ncbi:MAG: tellurite resistance TerB family protein [Geminocystis sp.]
MFGNQANFAPAEAFTIIILFSAISDGSFEDEEKDIILNILKRMKTFRYYGGNIVQLMSNCLKYLLKDPIQALAQSVISLPQELHETVFVVATDIIMSDGKVTEKEAATLDMLAKYLSISPTQVTKIIEVMAIKNKG